MTGYGLIGTGAAYRDQATRGLAVAADAENKREIQKKEMESQRKAATQQLGASGGGMIGFAVGGPIGAVVGAIAGALLGGAL